MNKTYGSFRWWRTWIGKYGSDEMNEFLRKRGTVVIDVEKGMFGWEVVKRRRVFRG